MNKSLKYYGSIEINVSLSRNKQLKGLAKQNRRTLISQWSEKNCCTHTIPEFPPVF